MGIAGTPITPPSGLQQQFPALPGRYSPLLDCRQLQRRWERRSLAVDFAPVRSNRLCLHQGRALAPSRFPCSDSMGPPCSLAAS